jgi:penicillin-binding protein 1C
MHPGAAFIVSDILSDRAGRAPAFGLDNALTTRFWSAVKTGTSKDMRDNWCIGYTRRHTVAVWVGNFEGDAMHDVSGVSGAAPSCLSITNALNADRADDALCPAGVVASRVRSSPRSSHRETMVLAGTSSRVSHRPSTGRIVAPPDGHHHIDPDIPGANQRLRSPRAHLPTATFELVANHRR